MSDRYRSLVPAYFGPWEQLAWERLIADRPAIVIINPADGPGRIPADGYAPLVERLQGVGSTVLIYVHTGYFTRSRPEIEHDVRHGLEWYGVDGVFFDEVPAEDFRRVRSELGFLARLSPGAVVFNAGRAVPSTWFRRVPDALFVTFEGTATEFADRFIPAAGAAGSTGLARQAGQTGPPERQVWLVHSLPARSHAKFMKLFTGAGIGFGYITHDRLPNPWDVYVPPPDVRKHHPGCGRT